MVWDKMQICWTEDQPSIRPVKEQIEQSGLIKDLIELIEKHNLVKAQANKRIEHPKGENNLYECVVARYHDQESRLVYIVNIRRFNFPNAETRGEVYQ